MRVSYPGGCAGYPGRVKTVDAPETGQAFVEAIFPQGRRAGRRGARGAARAPPASVASGNRPGKGRGLGLALPRPNSRAGDHTPSPWRRQRRVAPRRGAQRASVTPALARCGHRKAEPPVRQRGSPSRWRRPNRSISVSVGLRAHGAAGWPRACCALPADRAGGSATGEDRRASRNAGRAAAARPRSRLRRSRPGSLQRGIRACSSTDWTGQIAGRRLARSDLAPPPVSGSGFALTPLLR
jgi:hypothetical protein